MSKQCRCRCATRSPSGAGRLGRVCVLVAFAGLAGCTSASNTALDAEVAQTKHPVTAAPSLGMMQPAAAAAPPEPAATPAIRPVAGGSNASSPRSPNKADITTGSVKLPGAEAYLSAATPGSSAYRIGPHDVIEVSVFKVPDLARVSQVADTGTVNLPLVGEVIVGGRTAQEVERELTAKLGAKYLQSPQVTVSVREFNSQRVTIEGAVKTPGVYPIRGRTTLLSFMAIAGGIDSAVADNNVAVFRIRDGKRYAIRYSIDDIRTGQSEDPVISAGDVIVVSPSELKTAFNNVLKMLPLASLVALVP